MTVNSFGAGSRDTLIELQSYTTTQDDYGAEIETWGTLGQEWANINWGRGDERREAAMEQGSLSATFNVLDNTMTRAVAVKDRIMLDDAAWDITSNVPGKERGSRDITATRSV